MLPRCEVIHADPADVYPAVTPRKETVDTAFVEQDWSGVDCEGAGVTITQSTWEIHPNDDDGMLALGTETINGLIAGVFVSGGTHGKAYRLLNTVTLSDTRVYRRTGQLPVFDTLALGALA